VTLSVLKIALPGNRSPKML